MKYKLSVIQQSKALTFFLKNKAEAFSVTYTFSDTHPSFKAAKEWLEKTLKTNLYLEKHRVDADAYLALRKLHDVTLAVSSWSDGRLKITRNGTTYRGRVVPPAISDFLLKAFLANPNAEEAFAAWSNYIELVTDPDVTNKVAERLFLFLGKNDLRITDDGKVLAWKVVNKAYRDKHSDTIDNSVGQTPSIPRKDVDDNDNKYCSYGLHVCSWGYLSHFASTGDPVMQVEIDVRDIVSIPLDYDGEKVRVCKYKVVSEVGKWNVEVSAQRLPSLSVVGHTATV